MTTSTPRRRRRIYVEVDDDLGRAIDSDCKLLRLSPSNFIRWTLARQLLATQSLSEIAVERAR